MIRPLPSIERINELFRYDPEAGVLIRKVASGSRGHAGDIAGCLNGCGYVVVAVNDRDVRAHRMIWAIMTGDWPRGEIDHINGIRNDNRWCNLRSCSRAENAQNMRCKPSPTCDLQGVSWDARTQRWYVRIQVGRKVIFLGRFDIPEEGHAAYLAAKQKFHPFQPTLPKPFAGVSQI